MTPRGVAGNLLGVAYGFKKVDLPKKRSSFLFRDKNGKIGNLKNLFSKKTLFIWFANTCQTYVEIGFPKVKFGNDRNKLLTMDLVFIQFVIPRG